MKIVYALASFSALAVALWYASKGNVAMTIMFCVVAQWNRENAKDGDGNG
jgi:hypothetical protein